MLNLTDSKITEKQGNKGLTKKFVKELISEIRKHNKTTESSLYFVRRKNPMNHHDIVYNFMLVENNFEDTEKLKSWKEEDVVNDYFFLKKFSVEDFTKSITSLCNEYLELINPILSEQTLNGFFSTKIEFFNIFDDIVINEKNYYVYKVDLVNRYVFLIDKQGIITKFTEVNLLSQLSEWCMTLDTMGINVPVPTEEEKAKLMY